MLFQTCIAVNLFISLLLIAFLEEINKAVINTGICLIVSFAFRIQLSEARLSVVRLT